MRIADKLIGPVKVDNGKRVWDTEFTIITCRANMESFISSYDEEKRVNIVQVFENEEVNRMFADNCGDVWIYDDDEHFYSLRTHEDIENEYSMKYITKLSFMQITSCKDFFTVQKVGNEIAVEDKYNHMRFIKKVIEDDCIKYKDSKTGEYIEFI